MSTTSSNSKRFDGEDSANVALGGMTSADIDPSPYSEKQIVANGDDLAAIRANSALPADSWEEMDDAMYRAETDTLGLVSALRSAGLTSEASIYNEELTWSRVDTSHSATISMSPETETDEGAPTYGKQGVPLPIIHSDYSIGWRTQGESSLEPLNAYGASWTVNKAAEHITLYGWKPSIGGDGYSLYGFTNFPDAGNGTLGDWTTDPTNARSDIRAMIQQIKTEQNHAPGNVGYWLWLSSDLDDRLDDLIDPATADSPTVRERLNGLSGLSRIDMTDALEAGSALMFRPTMNVVDLALAEDLQTVQWGDQWRDRYKVLLAMTPRIKSTMQSTSGIAYWTQ